MTASDQIATDRTGPLDPLEPAVPRRALRVLAVPAMAGVGVAVGLGAYGSLHQPAGYAVSVAGFSSGAAAKTWLASAAFALGILQVVTAAGMWGRLGLEDRAWTAPVHRWSGRLAILLVLPVVTHCLYALGFQYGSPRALIHSLLGCVFFGAFVTKMLSLRPTSVPSWALPVFGGVLFTALTGLWLTSALWFFTTTGVTR